LPPFIYLILAIAVTIFALSLLLSLLLSRLLLRKDIAAI
jgi:hypothetical protein